MSSASFYRIKNSYRKSSVRTNSSSGASSGSGASNSSGSELDFDMAADEDTEDELEADFGDMYINEAEQDGFFDQAILKRIKSQSGPVKITLKLQVTENTYSVWETVLINDTLYVELPRVLLPEASKHSFLSMLEFAEERLECAQLVLHMRKGRQDRQNLMRTFLFLGFQPLSPKSPYVLGVGPQVIAEPSDSLFLMYTIADDEDDDETSSSEGSLSDDEE